MPPKTDENEVVEEIEEIEEDDFSEEIAELFSDEIPPEKEISDEEETPGKEAKGEEEEKEEKSAEEKEIDPGAGTEEKETPVVEKSEIPAEEEVDELAVTKARNEELQAQLTALANGTLDISSLIGEEEGTPAAEAAPVTQAAPVQAAAPVADPNIPVAFTEGFTFLNGADIEDIAEDNEAFENTMNRAGVALTNHIQQRVMQNIPAMVVSQVFQMQGLAKAVDSFYAENEDLMPVRAFVGQVSNQVAAKFPNLSTPQLMEKSAEVVRKALKMPAKQKPGSSEGAAGKEKKEEKPAFAKGAGGRNKTKISEGLQSDIDDIIEDF